ncbi:MAG: hypothetical protein M1822_006908 [Bathelium mastoideum]|nr:MAG: hypothetical protein M1822_006908 [Bathelium mastoideum]
METTTGPKHRLEFSQSLGRPPYVLDPEDLKDCQKLAPRVVRAEGTTVVKFGDDIRLAEAEALHLVSQKTTIAVPELIGAYILDGITYIITSYEEGEDFSDYWEAATPEVREGLIRQLKNYVQQMRKLKGNFIGSVDHSACRAGLFMWDAVGYERTYGPFVDEAAFNDGIVAALDNRFPPDHRRPENPEDMVWSEWRLRRLVRSLTNHEIVFTHGDLHGGNMLVRKDGTIVLLDWECAGYWPDYWEFNRAMYHEASTKDFGKEIERFVPPFYMEDFVMNHLYDRMVGG